MLMASYVQGLVQNFNVNGKLGSGSRAKKKIHIHQGSTFIILIYLSQRFLQYFIEENAFENITCDKPH